MDNFTRYTDDWHYASATSFFVAGDQRNVFVPGTRLRFSQIVDGKEVVKYALVASTAYSNSRTTVTVDSESDTIVDSNIFNPCYTYEYLVPNTTPASILDVQTVQIDDGAVTAAKLASALDLTAKDVKYAVKEGTPVNAVAATGTITDGNTTNVSDDETLTIGTRVYRFKDTPAQIDDIQIGADADTSLGNLVAAINNAAGEGTKYYTGTTINADVSAGAVAANASLLTAKTKGVVGNAIVLSTTASSLVLSGLSGGKLSGGIDGTLGAKYELFADASYLYVASAANTTAGQNWRRIALGSAY